MSYHLKAAQSGNGAREWLASISQQAAILSGAMAIMHPDMYATGREALVRLGRWASESGEDDVKQVSAIWPSIFSVASVMVNRASPLHIDSNGRPQWLDLLATVGTYAALDLVMPSIGMRLRYNPGCVVALSGQLLEHGAGHAEGDRGIVAFYMRDNVHQFLDVVRCNYAEYAKVGSP